jgi:hypothetical protein
MGPGVRRDDGRAVVHGFNFQTARTQSDFEIVITGLDPVIHLLRKACYED